jgi:hypothetical protein
MPGEALAFLSQGASKALAAGASLAVSDHGLFAGSDVAALASRALWWHQAALAFEVDVGRRLDRKPTGDDVQGLLDSGVAHVVTLQVQARLTVSGGCRWWSRRGVVCAFI